RAVAPCLRGLAIGLGPWINRASFLEDVLSLALLIAFFALGAIQVTAVASSRTPLFARGLAMLGGGLALLVALAAPSSDHLPNELLLTAAMCAASLSLLTGV